MFGRKAREEAEAREAEAERAAGERMAARDAAARERAAEQDAIREQVREERGGVYVTSPGNVNITGRAIRGPGGGASMPHLGSARGNGQPYVSITGSRVSIADSVIGPQAVVNIRNDRQQEEELEA